MASYRIVCTEQVPVSQPTTHAHIVAVGTGASANKAEQRWTVDEVWAAIDRRDTFYTKGETSGKIAYVRKHVCCNRRTLRSDADAVRDNNLDSLRRCSWKS